jgi:hypothetical protein
VKQYSNGVYDGQLKDGKCDGRGENEAVRETWVRWGPKQSGMLCGS